MATELTFTEEYTTNQSSTDLVTVADGKQIVIKSVNLIAQGDIGKVDLVFEGGVIAGKLYSSASKKTNLQKVKIKGGNGNNLQLTTTASTSNLFVAVIYEIEDI